MMGTARIAAGLVTLLCASVANAAPLYTIWQLEPVGEVGEIDIVEGTVFFEQRLVPFKMVQLTEAAQWKRNKFIDAGTVLFAVYQADGQIAYCTIKDQSNANAARSLFIPALDKRPCLVDADEDGVFDEYFTVFDTYGSALTPSGNLSSAKSMRAPAAYSIAPSSQFPVERRLAYSMNRIQSAESRNLSVSYDNGRGFQQMDSRAPFSTPESPAALNVVTHVLSVEGSTASVKIDVDEDFYIVGDSGGTFSGMALPAFAQSQGD